MGNCSRFGEAAGIIGHWCHLSHFLNPILSLFSHFRCAAFSSSIYNTIIDDDSFSGAEKELEMILIGKSSSIRFYGKGINTVLSGIDRHK
ncbi:MAG: hypothetical protein JWQ30_711 [Sediminibacterium sp.]|nr:hypothetical protein [Sediminibacterium sp.]